MTTLANIDAVVAKPTRHRGKELFARPARVSIIETGDGRSIAAIVAVAPAALRGLPATAMLPMQAAPPHSRLDVPRMGTS